MEEEAREEVRSIDGEKKEGEGGCGGGGGGGGDEINVLTSRLGWCAGAVRVGRVGGVGAYAYDFFPSIGDARQTDADDAGEGGGAAAPVDEVVVAAVAVAGVADEGVWGRGAAVMMQGGKLRQKGCRCE